METNTTQQGDKMDVRATQLATTVATQHGITRNAAFDMILAVAGELEIKGYRFTAKQAGEIESIIAQSIKSGVAITLNRPAIGKA